MSKRLFASVMSMESQSPVIPDNVTEKELVEQTLLVEEAAIDINEDIHEFHKTMISVEELEYALESLERIHGSMESQAVLTKSTARGYQIAYSNILGDVLPNPIASLEGFKEEVPEEMSFSDNEEEGKDDKVVVDKDDVTLEAEKASKSIIATILEKLQAAWAKAKEIADFVWSKIISAVPRLKGRISGLQSRIQQIQRSNTTTDVSEVKVPRATSLVLGGKLSHQIFINGFNRVQKEIFSNSEDILKAADTFYTAIERAYKASDQVVDGVQSAQSEMIDSVRKLTLIENSAELPGGRMLSWQEPAGEGLVAFQPPTIDDHPDAKDYDEDGRMNLLSLSDMDRYAKQLYKFVLDMEKGDRKRAQLVKREQAAEKVVAAWAKEQESDTESGLSDTQVVKVIRASHSNLKTTLARLDNYLFNYCRVVSGAIEAHLKAYPHTE